MRHFKSLLLGSAALSLLTLQPAQAQTVNDAARIDRIERELRAVQRRVFAGAESGLFQPEVQPGETPTTPPGEGGTPVADLTARVDALEAQLARLTGQIEQQDFRLREMQAAITRLQTDTAAARSAATANGASSGTPSGTSGGTATGAPTSILPTPTPTPAPVRVTPAPAPVRPATNNQTATPAPANAATTAARRARVEAIEVPATGNAPEDDYLYGYRLWEARLYPEAQAQLRRVVERHANHRRASYAGNLLGRALLDNNQAALAVTAFYDNYRNRPRGERAPHSLHYMGMALIRLDRRTDACRTFDEFDRIYGATADAALRGEVAQGRVQARC
jgi:TolA-binding protein